MELTQTYNLIFNGVILAIDTTVDDNRLPIFADKLKNCKHVMLVCQYVRVKPGHSKIIIRLFKGYNKAETEAQIKQIFDESLR